MKSIKIYYRVRDTGLGYMSVEFFHDEAVAKWAEEKEEDTEHRSFVVPRHLTQSSVGTLEINVTQGLSKIWGGKDLCLQCTNRRRVLHEHTLGQRASTPRV